MKLKITVDMNNQAFKELGFYELQSVIITGLKKLYAIDEQSRIPLYDSNGNRVGLLVIEDD